MNPPCNTVRDKLGKLAPSLLADYGKQLVSP